MLCSGINVNALAAEENTKMLVVDSVKCDSDMQYVTITGHTTDKKAFADILIEVLAVDTDKNVLDEYLASTENIAQITANEYGEFEYSFPLGRTDKDEFDVYVTASYCGDVAKIRLKPYDRASDKLVVDSVRCDNNTQYVTVKGHTTDEKAFADILIEVLAADTDKNDLDEYLNSMENIAQITTNMHGEFEYSFPVGRTDNKELDVYVTAPYCGKTSKTRLKLYDTGSEDELLNSAVIMQAGNKLAIKKNTRVYTEYAPYMSENGLMIDTQALAECFDAVVSDTEITVNGTTKAVDFTENGGRKYINAGSLAEFGLYVHNSDEINAVVVTEKTGDYNYEKMTEALGIYMSDGGSDTNDGSFDKPVKSIERAIALAKARDYGIAKTVYVREGSYRLTKSVDIENVNGLYITAYNGENVVFTGASKVNKEDFALLSDPDKLARVKQKAKGKIYTLDLSECMTAAAGDIALYEDNVLANVGRYPDNGYITAKFSGSTVNIDSADKRMWKNEPDGKLFGYFPSSYETTSADFSINDSMEIVTGFNRNDSVPLRAYNMLCETDSPGEYYIEDGILYYYPMGELENVEITDLRFELFNITNSENVTLDGIVAEKNKNNAITISGSKNVNVLNSEIRHIAGNGISISNSFDTTVDGCKIYDLRNSGVEVVNCGKYVTLQSGNTMIKNSRIYNFANTGSVGNAGVRIAGGMDTTVYGCVIHDSAAQGITVGGGYGHTVEKCDIYNVTNYMSDAGAVYFNTGVLGRGSKVIDNYIHDIVCGYNGNVNGEVYAIYLDDFTGGAVVSGNTIANIRKAGKIGGGRDNTITNNIIIGAWNGINYDNRGAMGVYMFHPKAMAGSTQEFNGTDGGLYSGYFDLIANSEYDPEKWYAKYPGFKKLAEDIELEKAYWAALNDDSITDKDSYYYDAALPVNTILTNNVSVNPAGYELPLEFWWDWRTQYNTNYKNNLSVAAKIYNQRDVTQFSENGNTFVSGSENVTAAKAWFEDYANDNYQLKADNGISSYLSGFKNINLAEAGSKVETSGMGAPKLTAPVNNANVKNTTEFSWRKTGEGDYFMLEISENADMTSPVYTEITNKTALTVKGLDEGTYYWRVTAIDKSLAKAVSAQSEIYTVNVAGDYVAVKDYGFKQDDTAIAVPTAGKTTMAYINSDFVKLKNDNAIVIFVLKSADGKTKDIATVPVTADNKASDIEYEFTYQEKDSVEMFIWSNTGDDYQYTNKIVIG